jgi:Ca2+-binding EF-hand superfamily protein
MYYKHEKYNIENYKLNTINQLFAEYDIAGLGRITPKNARLLLQQIGIVQQDAQNLVLKADVQKRGTIKKDTLIETMREHWSFVKAEKDIKDVFETILKIGLAKQDNDIPRNYVTINDVRAVADQLHESIDEQDLREMFDYADPQRTGRVSVEEFQKIMKKTVVNVN